MIKHYLISFVKAHTFIYNIYYFIMTLFVNFLKIFVKPNDKLILFVSYGGRYFNDSPYNIYRQMQEDSRFKDYSLVWAFRNPDDFDVANKIKIDTLKYFITALQARCWITNVSVERALGFKGKNTYYFHTTHTTIPKVMGNDICKGEAFSSRSKFLFDCSCAQSSYEAELQCSMFNLTLDQIILSGYPKNDRLANYDESERVDLRQKLGIADDKIVILYAPTYRENSPSEMLSPVDFDKWKRILGEKYVVLFRVHPTVVDQTKIDKNNKFLINVSQYNDNVDLMIASDILISDYSGIFFEFAVLKKPMFCYAYDYEEYVSTRKLYFDIRKELPGGGLNEDELLNLIANGISEKEQKILNDFEKKYVTFYGSATNVCVDHIYKAIG